MNAFTVIGILITLAALLDCVNHRLVRLPTTIGLMLLSLAGAVGLIGLHALGRL